MQYLEKISQTAKIWPAICRGSSSFHQTFSLHKQLLRGDCMQFGFLSNMRKVSADSHWLTAAADKMQRRFSGCCLQTVSSASLYSTYWPISHTFVICANAYT